MANTLTSLIPDVYAALDVVSRELVGVIPSVARNASADRVAKGQTLRAFQTPANTAGADIAAAMAIPAAADQTIVFRYRPSTWWMGLALFLATSGGISWGWLRVRGKARTRTRGN